MTIDHFSQSPDYEAIKSKQQVAWGSGHYPTIGSLIVYMSESLCEDADFSAGQKLLDIATGSGNTAIAAARRRADVTGIDYVQSLLDVADRRSKAESVSAAWKLADAEDLPFDDNTFAVVTSVCGVMFAPNQSQAASEMVRVCKPGGMIVVANWTPDGFIGALLKVVGSFVAPPPGVESPLRWGTRDGVEQLLGGAGDLSFTEKDQVFRLVSADDFVDVFTTNYGPLERARASLDTADQAAMDSQLTDLVNSWNTAKDGTIRIPAQYLETTAIAR